MSYMSVSNLEDNFNLGHDIFIAKFIIALHLSEQKIASLANWLKEKEKKSNPKEWQNF
jgi:hypothetical protein